MNMKRFFEIFSKIDRNVKKEMIGTGMFEYSCGVFYLNKNNPMLQGSDVISGVAGSKAEASEALSREKKAYIESHGGGEYIQFSDEDVSEIMVEKED